MIGIKNDEKMRKGRSDNTYNTEVMLPISEIRGDTIILKDGGLRGIIKVYGLNLDLRNYDEQQVVIEQYKRFLNGLSFPIQIYIRNTYLDLTEYINYMKDKVNRIENDVLKWQGESYLRFIDEINSKKGLIYTKEFYIIVPYYDSGLDSSSVRKSWIKKFMDALEQNESPDKIVARYRSFVKNSKHLDSRCNLIIDGLRGLNIVAERLGLKDIIALLFRFYNPNSHTSQSEI